MRCLLAAFAMAVAGVSSACVRATAEPLTLATTTSVGNSGLLETLLPAFERRHGFSFRSHLVGSGLALKMLNGGNVDLVISHAPAAAAAALDSHPHWRYRKVMFNDFVLLGPPSDPAGVRQAADTLEAMRRIAGSTSRFLSRGDRSGTHEREEVLWLSAGVRPTDGGLIVAGAAMGATLRIASETDSYTLSDRATFVRLARSLHLVIVFEGEADLLNTYSVIFDERGPHATSAQRFADWLAGNEGRQAIEAFRADRRPVYFPWPQGRPSGDPSALPR